MKTIQHITANDALDNRMSVSNHPVKVPKAKLLTGSVTGMYPVVLDDGRTIIYTTDKSRENEIRTKYAQRMEKFG